MGAFLWAIAIGLAVVVGLRALAGALGRNVAAGTDAMANPHFTTMTFSELPGWVRRRLAGLRDQFIAFGFTELTSYTRNSPRENYTCVLVSPDGLTVANLWVARTRGASLWVIAPMLGWSAFRNELLASPRFGLTTHFSDARMIETTPVELLARSHVAGEIELVIVPREMPLPAVRERHAIEARDFGARLGSAPVPMTSAEQFFDCQRALIARVAKDLRRKMAS